MIALLACLCGSDQVFYFTANLIHTHTHTRTHTHTHTHILYAAVFGPPSGDLMIGVDSGVETSVTIPSRNGCREVLRCTGNGTSVEWRRIGSRRPVMETEGNKRIMVSQPVGVVGVWSQV